MKKIVPKNVLLFANLLLIGSSVIISSLGSQGFQSILSIGRVKATFIVFKDGNLIKAKNVLTGIVDFRATGATEVISQAINALNVGGGGVLVINSSLQLSWQIVLNNISHIKIVGVNLPTLTFELPDEVLISRDKGFSILIRNSKNITIEGIDFFYDSDKTAKYIKFRFKNKGITIRDCIFRSCMPPSDPQPESYFIPHDGISLSVTEGATGEHTLENFTFEGNNASGSAVDFIAIHNVRNFAIRDNLFIDAAARRWDKMTGPITNTAGGSCITITGENGVISDNLFLRVEQPEIFHDERVKHVGGVLFTCAGVHVARNVIISNNVFNKTKTGVALDPGIENITIMGNIVFIDASKYGREDGIAVRELTNNITVVANRVYKPYRNGIMLVSSSRDIVVQDNYFEFAQREGIRIETNCTRLLAINNTVRNNGQDISLPSTEAARAGIGVRGNQVSITNNTICDDQTSPTQTFGIAIEETASEIFVANNTIYDNITADIRNRGKDITVEG